MKINLNVAGWNIFYSVFVCIVVQKRVGGLYSQFQVYLLCRTFLCRFCDVGCSGQLKYVLTKMLRNKFEEKFSFSTNKESFKLYRTWTSGFSLYPSSPLNLLSQRKSFYLPLTVCVQVILLVFYVSLFDETKHQQKIAFLHFQ